MNSEMVPTFPLLKLDETNLSRFLDVLPICDRVTLALCSKRCKKICISKPTKCSRIWLNLSGHFQLHVDLRHCDLYFRFIFDEPDPLSEPIYVRVVDQQQEWRSQGLNGRQWIIFLMEFFQREKMEVAFGRAATEFTVQSLRETFTHIKLEMLRFCAGCPDEYVRSVLNTFQGMEGLDFFYTSLLRDTNSIHQIYSQNLNKLCIRNPYISLNDLLVMNCRHFHFMSQTISAKIVNRFVKMWMNGSNPELEYLLCMMQRVHLHKNGVLKDITCSELPIAERRKFRRNGITIIEDGYHIFRNDGRKAKIYFGCPERILIGVATSGSFEMVVCTDF